MNAKFEWKKREIGDIDTLNFMDWSIKHFPGCMMNHEGSAWVHVIFYKLLDFLFYAQVAEGKPWFQPQSCYNRW